MIVTVTLNPARDKTVVIHDFLPGKVNRIVDMREDAGGKGVNVSKVIKSIGGESVATGILGGSAGRYIAASLTEMGIRNDFVFTQAETRTNLKIVDPKNHTNTDINEPGLPVPKRVLTNVYNKLGALCGAGDIVIFSGRAPAGAPAELIENWSQKLIKRGIRVFLDADSTTLAEGVKAAPYLIKPNDLELMQLVGAELKTPAEFIRAARSVIRIGVRLVAVSMGARGALFVTEKTAYLAQPLNVTVVSTVGAGDAMMAALAYGIDSGKRMIDTYRLAMAASAAAVTCTGSQAADIETVRRLQALAVVEKYHE